MDIRSSLDGLKSLLGAQPTQTAATPTRSTSSSPSTSLSSDRATLSNAGSEVAQTASDSDVRMEKVASIRAALSAGTYNIPASAVASKMVDAMLGATQ